MNNKLIVRTRLDVANRDYFNLFDAPNAYSLKTIIEAISGVMSVTLWPNSSDSLIVHFDKNRLNEVVWATQAALNKLDVTYITNGNYAPKTANWAGYSEVPLNEREGIEQRTEVIKTQYETLTRHVKSANDTAWTIGRLLSEQRVALAHNKHGGFNGWLEAEFPEWGRSSAYRFISVYEMYPNRPTVGQLEVSLTVLYQLASPSTPESARVEIQERAEQGETITKSKAAEIIASHKLPPSENDIDCSDFTEADFEELNQADSGDKADTYATGTPGYSYIDGGKQVIHDSTGEVFSLEQFAIIKELAESTKAKTATKSKSRKSSGGGSGGGGHKRTAEQVHGDSLAVGLSRGYVAQVERAAERDESAAEWLKAELKNLSEPMVSLLALACANSQRDSQAIPDEMAYVVNFVVKYGVEAQS